MENLYGDVFDSVSVCLWLLSYQYYCNSINGFIELCCKVRLRIDYTIVFESLVSLQI